MALVTPAFVLLVAFCIFIQYFLPEIGRFLGAPREPSTGLGVDEEGQTQCTICITGGCDFVTRCRHEFHTSCISTWLQHQPHCPNCKCTITESAVVEGVLLGAQDRAALEAAVRAAPDVALLVAEAARVGESGVLRAIAQDTDPGVFRDGVSLWTACERGHVDAVQVLVGHGAGLNARNAHGYTPLHCACWSGSLELVMYLLAQGAILGKLTASQDSALHVAASSGRATVVQFLLLCGAPVNQRNQYGSTPLHKATWCACEDAVVVLLAWGADVNATEDTFGFTPLHHAAIKEQIVIADRLLDHGAHVNTNDKKDARTPLHHAAENNSMGVGLMLLQKCAHINAADRAGATPLHLAAANGHALFVHLLLVRGANAGLKDQHGRTAMDLAAGHPQTMAVFQRHSVSSSRWWWLW